jgi:hypothetical protein
MLHERMVSEVNCFHGLVIFTGAFRPAVHCEHSDVLRRWVEITILIKISIVH